MTDAGEVLGELGGGRGFAKGRGPVVVEVRAGGDRRGGEAGVVDVVVEDEAVAHPHAAVGDALAEAVVVEEVIGLALPDATGVAPAGHVAHDEEDEAAAGLVCLRVAVVGEPSGNDRVEEAAALGQGDGRPWK